MCYPSSSFLAKKSPNPAFVLCIAQRVLLWDGLVYQSGRTLGWEPPYKYIAYPILHAFFGSSMVLFTICYSNPVPLGSPTAPNGILLEACTLLSAQEGEWLTGATLFHYCVSRASSKTGQGLHALPNRGQVMM